MTKSDAFPKIEDKTELEEGMLFAPNFDAHGFLPAIVTSAETGEVLMFAYMNADALALTIKTGEAHYWSRSRQALWRKGETSGNCQRIVELRTDCDQDVIWLSVTMTGSGACCHTGRKSCFYRAVPLRTDPSAGLTMVPVDAERQFDPDGRLRPRRRRKGNFKEFIVLI